MDNVSLKVYDVLGKKYLHLLTSSNKLEHLMLHFNGSNLSSGVYYYQLTAGELTATKKLMLTK